MEEVKSIDEVFKIAECLTRREIYKIKVSFVCRYQLPSRTYPVALYSVVKK